MIWRAILVWFGLAALAVVNGLFREKILAPKLGDAVGHVLSTLLLCLLIFLSAALFLVRKHITQPADQWLIGVVWLGLTVAFEFGFGHFAMKKPWRTLSADYNLLKGRIWMLVLLTTLLSPVLAGIFLSH